MWNLPIRLLFNCSRVKVHYPFFLAHDYTPLEYSQYYYQQGSKLVIDRANQYQICYTTLPNFLTKQLEEDKTLFRKQKQLLFVGRSNSGKSSLINAIFNNIHKKNKKKIARVSKSSGTTKFLHFHHIKNKQAFLVDAPGYGYAKMNKKRRQMWFGLTQEYMKVSSRLSQIFICINLEHGLKSNDILFLKRCERYNIDMQIILTKIDKVPKRFYFHKLQAIVQGIKRLNLNKVNQRIIAVSTKSKFGVQVLRSRLIESLQQSQQRNIDYQQDLLLSYVKELRVQRTKIQHQQKTQSKQYLLRKLIYQSQLTKYLK